MCLWDLILTASLQAPALAQAAIGEVWPVAAGAGTAEEEALVQVSLVRRKAVWRRKRPQLPWPQKKGQLRPNLLLKLPPRA